MIDAEFKRVWIEDDRELLAEGEIGGRYGIWPLAWVGMRVRDGKRDHFVTTDELRTMMERLQKVVRR